MRYVYSVLLVSFLFPLNLSADSVVATVNETDILQDEVNEFVAKSLPGANYTDMNSEQKQQVLDQLIDRTLYLNVAKSEKIYEDADYLAALEKVKENLMLDIWMKKRLEAIAVSDDEMRSYYREHSSQFKQSAAASARHILVTTEAEASEIIKELQATSNLEAKFIELAETRSTGPSGLNGGDLGWFNEDQMVPEFSEAALALEKGQISTIPVKTQFGYHIIYLTDKRPAGLIPYDTVKDNISRTLKLKKFKQNLNSLSQNLRKSAKITVK